MEQSSGKTAAISLDNGNMVICTATASTSGATRSSMKGNMSTIRNMGTASTSGPMVASIKASGRMENNMALLNTKRSRYQLKDIVKRSRAVMDFGRPVAALNGTRLTNLYHCKHSFKPSRRLPTKSSPLRTKPSSTLSIVLFNSMSHWPQSWSNLTSSSSS